MHFLVSCLFTFVLVGVSCYMGLAIPLFIDRVLFKKSTTGFLNFDDLKVAFIGIFLSGVLMTSSFIYSNDVLNYLVSYTK